MTHRHAGLTLAALVAVAVLLVPVTWADEGKESSDPGVAAEGGVAAEVGEAIERVLKAIPETTEEMVHLAKEEAGPLFEKYFEASVARIRLRSLCWFGVSGFLLMAMVGCLYYRRKCRIRDERDNVISYGVASLILLGLAVIFIAIHSYLYMTAEFHALNDTINRATSLFGG